MSEQIEQSDDRCLGLSGSGRRFVCMQVGKSEREGREGEGRGLERERGREGEIGMGGGERVRLALWHAFRPGEPVNHFAAC
jgi:hypothetical protein